MHRILLITIFVIDCFKQCFLIKFYQILWEKALKIKVKITDIFGAKINHFLSFRKYQLFCCGVNTS